MKRTIFWTLAAFIISFFCFTTLAGAQQLKVATGGPKGTYAAEMREMLQVCGSDIALVPVATSGAVENLDLLMGNQVNMGFVQSDLLYRRARTEDLGNVKTLIALHPEQLHFIARSELRKVGGTLGFGGKEFTLTSIEQLQGLRLAAGGGAVETAKQVKTDSDIGYTIVEVKSADEALEAVKTRQADAALLVGGKPLGNVAALGRDFVLLSVSPQTTEKLKGAYKPAKLSYPQLNAAGVSTVAIDALLVTREYKTAGMVNSLARFRSCVLSHLDELKETTGTHPAWQTVDGANKGKWAFYDLPAVRK